jgi:hypothetical protein
LQPAPGGRGTSVELAAPEIWLDGRIQGGHGGRGAQGFAGGAGGSVTFVGAFRTHAASPRPNALGGEGGHAGTALAGQAGPKGGDVGGVYVREAGAER